MSTERSEDFLSEFQSDLSNADTELKLPERLPSKIASDTEFLLSPGKDFKQQYAHIYASRLMKTRHSLEEASKVKWGKKVLIRHLFELKLNQKCVVIGTIYKQQHLKPNILHEIGEQNSLAIPPPPRDKYTCDEDELILEDELQRISLKGNIQVSELITGVVVAVYGEELEEDRGRFQVEDYCCKPLMDQIPRPLLTEDKYILLVSGFEMGSHNTDMLAAQLLIDLLTGQAGSGDQQNMLSKVSRVIIAGNIISSETQDRDSLNKAKYLTKNITASSVDAIKAMDYLLAELASTVPVDVMSGGNDPANYLLPQQPLHACLFPQAARYNTFNRCTNPYKAVVDGVQLLGHSGQPVDDVYAFTDLTDRLNILSNTLSWGHIAPSAPDTLHCYPYYDEDPFVLSCCPHVYFCGNQPTYQTKLLSTQGKEVRILCLPSFSSTNQAVLLNLKDLSCAPINIKTEIDGKKSYSPGGEK